MTAERLGRLLWVAFGLVLVVLFVKFFVADVYRVSSGSMRPTIFAGPLRQGEEPLEEWVLVSYARDVVPERFDLVVWDREGVGAVVKRVVGLPGESVRVSDGDLWIDGARLPAGTPRPVPVTVFDSDLSPVEDYFHFRGAAEGGPWTREGNEWLLAALEVPAGQFLGMMSYHPELRDDYLDADGRRVVGKRTINDAAIDCEFRIEEGAGRLRFLLTEKADIFELRISPAERTGEEPGGTHRVELLRRSAAERDGEPSALNGVLVSKSVDLPPGEWQRLRFSNVDNHLIVAMGDAAPLMVESYGSNELQPGRSPDSDQHVGSRVEFGADGLSVRFRSLRILRDLFYVSEEGGRGVAEAEHLGPDAVWLLGDNSTQSQDSRTFGPVSVGELIGVPRCVVWPPRMMRMLRARQ